MKYVVTTNRILLCLFAIGCFFWPIFLVSFHGKQDIVIVVPSYNNEKWYSKNLSSILYQKYDQYRILYVDDASKDATSALVQQYLKEAHIDFHCIDFDELSDDIPTAAQDFARKINEQKHFFTFVRNKKRAGALANLYRMIHSCKEEEIVVTVDGDDWLADDEVLNTVNAYYQSSDVWFTHGTLKEYPWGHVAWCEPVPSEVIASNAFRAFKCPSHLRTFYAWLFKKIALEDFLYEGKFFPMAWDMAIMYPIAEMAGERHAFISKVVYIYNMSNPINDNRINAQLQNDLDAWIRKKKPYQRLLLY